MATIIPRVQPGQVGIQVGQGARNTTRVSAAPAQAIAQGIAGASDQLFKYAQQQAEINDTAAIMRARRQLSEWEASINDPANQAGIASFRGQRALDANEVLVPELDKRLAEINEGLTAGQRAKFAGVAESFREGFGRQLNSHMDREFTAWRAAEQKAAVDQLGNDAILAGMNGDEQGQEDRLQELIGMRQAQLEADGIGGAAAAADIRGLASTVRARTIKALAGRDPMAAESLMQKHLGQLTASDRAEVESVLVPVVNAVRDEDEADAIMAGLPVAQHRDPGQRGQPAPEIAAILDDAAERHGVPRHLLYALAEQESSFRPDAVNPEVLDDGDQATGLMQYRLTSAGGIDRMDARASADRAAAELARRLRVGGEDYAIAAHFAGEGGADAVVRRGRRAENPKTAEYIEQVRGRGERWRVQFEGGAQGARTGAQPTGQQGEQGGAGPASAQPAQSLAQALARADETIADPIRRRRVKAVIESRFAQRDAAKREQDQAMSEGIMTAMYQVEGDTRPLRQRLTPEQYQWAQVNGKLEALELIRTNAITGQFVQDDLPFKEGLFRQAATDPAEFAKVNLYDPALQARLSTDTLHRLTSMQEAVKRDGAKGVEEWATESQLLGQAYTALNLLGSGNAKKREEFELAYLREKRVFNERNGGRNPSAAEQQEIINRLKLPMARERWFGLSTANDRYVYQAAEGTSVPAEDRAKIIAALREDGIANPTEADILEAYQLAAGSEL